MPITSSSAAEPIERASGPQAHILAQGDEWRLTDFICTAGPDDRPFEEKHSGVSLAMVMEGTFTYQSTDGRAFLHPGALLLNRHGCCYECAHDHGTGDRCLSFNFAPDFFSEIAASITGDSHFQLPVKIPAFNRRMILSCVEVQAMARAPRKSVPDEIAIRFAENVLTVAAGTPAAPQRISARDERRIADVVRHIDTHPDAPHALPKLCALAGMSKYHFLRVFQRIMGATPHQYILKLRMRRAAHDVITTDKTIAAIIFDNGFGDVSTFNSQFRSLFGTTPSGLRTMTRPAIG